MSPIITCFPTILHLKNCHVPPVTICTIKPWASFFCHFTQFIRALLAKPIRNTNSWLTDVESVGAICSSVNLNCLSGHCHIPTFLLFYIYRDFKSVNCCVLCDLPVLLPSGKESLLIQQFTHVTYLFHSFLQLNIVMLWIELLFPM
jgi:hypothetical protein